GPNCGRTPIHTPLADLPSDRSIGRSYQSIGHLSRHRQISREHRPARTPPNPRKAFPSRRPRVRDPSSASPESPAIAGFSACWTRVCTNCLHRCPILCNNLGVQSAAPDPSARSSVEATVEILRARILDGVLGPGARIVEEQTSAELAVSRHTLRAALQQLVSDGLLSHEAHRGVRVPVLEASGIAD